MIRLVIVTTLAGTQGISGISDDVGTAAKFNTPTGLAIDAAGNLFVVDAFNNRIRKIDETGHVTTVAGSGLATSLDDSGLNASFNGPRKIAVDAFGNLYVGEYKANLIRKINLVGDTVNFRADFADAAGNSGSVYNTTDNSLVEVDLEAPVILNDSMIRPSGFLNLAKLPSPSALPLLLTDPVKVDTTPLEIKTLRIM